MILEEVTLVGKTPAGKDLIAERGSRWAVIDTRDNHPATNIAGTWLSLAAWIDPLDIRPLWVQSHNDTDFIVTFEA